MRYRKGLGFLANQSRKMSSEGVCMIALRWIIRAAAESFGELKNSSMFATHVWWLKDFRGVRSVP